MKKENINKILENHSHWKRQDCEGWENMRATFVGVSLRGVDLKGADLSGAVLRSANLRGADLRDADLSCAVLIDVDLSNTNLMRADLRCADLRSSDLRDSDLSGADLSYADLRHADLGGADLGGANLGCVYLMDAYLSGANLRRAKDVPFIPMACPDKGEFVGFKKASGKIVELKIMEHSKRCSATGRKCRCDQAKVLSITNLDGTESTLAEVQSDYDADFVYRVGEIVSVEDFCDDRWNECSKGIHFFINRQEAVEY